MIMKKLTLILLLLLATMSFAQNTFVHKYTYYYTKENDVVDDGKKTNVTIVFNEKDTSNIVLYFGTKKRTLYKTGELENNVSNGGHKYQYIECIDDEGTEIGFQFFDDTGTVRLIYKDGYLEFHK
jgi:hypothetical protein